MNKIVIPHKCKYENGKLIFFNPDLLNKYLQNYKNKHLNATFRLIGKNRTLEQNARHWARMTFAADILGDRTPEELHYDFCRLFLTDYSVTPPKTGTTRSLSTAEFNKFEENIDIELAKMGIVIPEPGQEFTL